MKLYQFHMPTAVQMQSFVHEELHEIEAMYHRVRPLSENVSDEMANAFSCKTVDHPVEFFNGLQRNVVSAVEIISMYRSIWEAPGAYAPYSHMMERAIEENGRRIKFIQNSHFISLLSHFEYNLQKHWEEKNKTGVNLYPRVKKNFYLSDAIKDAFDSGFITDDEKSHWLGLNYFRNALVHNDSYAKESGKYEYLGEPLNQVEGQAIESSMRLQPKIAEWILTSAKSWLLKTI